MTNELSNFQLFNLVQLKDKHRIGTAGLPESGGPGHTGFLAEISFTPLLYHPGGCLVCPEMGTRSSNNNLFVRSAVFQPKWNDIQKTYKNHQNPVESYCFL